MKSTCWTSKYIYYLSIIPLMPEGRLILKKSLMYSHFFLWVKHIRMLRCWWAWWEFITLFSWYFMHVWNFLLQKRRMIRAENFNFSITYPSCVSFFSDNAIHNVWYQTCPDLQFSFRFPIFSSAISTQQLVLLQRWRNWLLQLEVCQTAPDCSVRSPQLSQDHN